MGLLQLVAKCQSCPRVDICDHKCLEAVGILPPKAKETLQSASGYLEQPLLRETMKIVVNGNPAIVYKDDVLKELMRSYYEYLGLPGYLQSGS